MKKNCKICGKEFETNLPQQYACGYKCRKKANYEIEKKRRENTKRVGSFSLDFCPYETGAIKRYPWHYDELKPCEV